MGIKHALSWAGYRFTSTILDDIQYQVLFFAAFAAMVCAVSNYTDRNLGINPIMISVIGTVVSLTVSFKSNSAYARFWEGRNIWANLTSTSRHMAMLIWLQVPNVKPPPKDDPKDKKKDKKSKKSKTRSKATSRRSHASLATDASEPTETLLHGFSVHDTPKKETVKLNDVDSRPGSSAGKRVGHGNLPEGVREKVKDRDFTAGSRASTLTNLGEKSLSREDKRKMRNEVAGMVEKKTYIGLVQAFAVAMKHALRGESGPFYTDLYSLIAFLPKYNPSVQPPVAREHLFPGWDNGIPRQKIDYDDDSIAVPLTVPATFSGYAFEMPSGTDKIDHPPSVDQEKVAEAGQFTTTSYAFRHQALTSASAYVRNEGESRRHCFARLDKKHRVIRQSEDKRNNNVPITTVELMPPRHPPAPQYWDFFPPLRLIKVWTDWLRKRERVQKQERVRGGKRKRAGGVKSEIPQEIIMYLSAYVDDLVRREMINASYIGLFMGCILDLQKALTDLEKIASTPIPSAYSFHLRLTVWAYLLFLPFQIYPLLGWITVPAVAIAAITYLGFLEIGAQIEMPFSYDQSDLDLDKFVLKIAHQLAEVTAFPCDVSSSQIILSHLNQPLLPTSSLSAPDLLGVDETRPRPNPAGFHAAFEAVKDIDIPSATKDKKGAKSKAKAKAKAKKEDQSPSPSFNSSSSCSSSESSDSCDPDEDETQTDTEAASTLSYGLASATGIGKDGFRPVPMTTRDMELALTANWRAISSETDSFIGKPRQQLENRTGIEVAVMTL